MSDPPDDVKVAPMFEGGSTDNWRTHLYNQERILAGQDRIGDAIEGLLKTQERMSDFASKLNTNMDTLDETLRESSKAQSGFQTQIIKVPIVIVLVGLASWGFYIGKLSERGWILILAVAAFPYLGDGIIAIFKIIRGQPVNGEKK